MQTLAKNPDALTPFGVMGGRIVSLAESGSRSLRGFRRMPSAQGGLNVF
jgi:hypothetical protein